jgi:type I restriction enzyme M protein
MRIEPLVVNAELSTLDTTDRSTRRKATRLRKDRDALESRLSSILEALNEIGGELNEDQARELILGKLYDVARGELDRYLGAERSVLVRAVQDLWDKYATSSQQLETQRAQAHDSLASFLSQLGYSDT